MAFGSPGGGGFGITASGAAEEAAALLEAYEAWVAISEDEDTVYALYEQCLNDEWDDIKDSGCYGADTNWCPLLWEGRCLNGVVAPTWDEINDNGADWRALYDTVDAMINDWALDFEAAYLNEFCNCMADFEEYNLSKEAGEGGDTQCNSVTRRENDAENCLICNMNAPGSGNRYYVNCEPQDVHFGDLDLDGWESQLTFTYEDCLGITFDATEYSACEDSTCTDATWWEDDLLLYGFLNDDGECEGWTIDKINCLLYEHLGAWVNTGFVWVQEGDSEYDGFCDYGSDFAMSDISDDDPSGGSPTEDGSDFAMSDISDDDPSGGSPTEEEVGADIEGIDYGTLRQCILDIQCTPEYYDYYPTAMYDDDTDPGCGTAIGTHTGADLGDASDEYYVYWLPYEGGSSTGRKDQVDACLERYGPDGSLSDAAGVNYTSAEAYLENVMCQIATNQGGIYPEWLGPCWDDFYACIGESSEEKTPYDDGGGIQIHHHEGDGNPCNWAQCAYDYLFITEGDFEAAYRQDPAAHFGGTVGGALEWAQTEAVYAAVEAGGADCSDDACYGASHFEGDEICVEGSQYCGAGASSCVDPVDFDATNSGHFAACDVWAFSGVCVCDDGYIDRPGTSNGEDCVLSDPVYVFSSPGDDDVVVGFDSDVLDTIENNWNGAFAFISDGFAGYSCNTSAGDVCMHRNLCSATDGTTDYTIFDYYWLGNSAGITVGDTGIDTDESGETEFTPPSYSDEEEDGLRTKFMGTMYPDSVKTTGVAAAAELDDLLSAMVETIGSTSYSATTFTFKKIKNSYATLNDSLLSTMDTTDVEAAKEETTSVSTTMTTTYE